MGGFSHFPGGVSKSFKNFVILNISQTSQDRHANNRSKSKDIPLLCWRLPHPCLVCHFLLTPVLAAILLRNGVPSTRGSARPAASSQLAPALIALQCKPCTATQGHVLPGNKCSVWFLHTWFANLHGKESLTSHFRRCGLLECAHR